MPQASSTGLATLLLDLACIGAVLGVAGEGDLSVRAVAWFAAWSIAAQRFGAHLHPGRPGMPGSVKRALESWVVTVAAAGLVDVALLSTPPASVWLVALVGGLLLVLWRLLLVRASLAPPGLARPRVLLIGANEAAAGLAGQRHARRVFDLRGLLPFPGERVDAVPDLQPLGELSGIEDVLAEHEIDLAVVCPSDRVAVGDVEHVLRACDQSGLSARLFPPFLNLQNLHVSLAATDGNLGLSLESRPNASAALLVKRGIDIVGAVIGLFLLLPALVACALAVKLTSRGPVLFGQVRVGKNGHQFRCLKFRTMKVGAQLQQEHLRQRSIQDGPAFKIPNDPRLTPVGGFLRRYSLDELPQMLNVLLGDMSIVGPRPPIPSEVERYAWWQRRRVSVKPGLTCIWQVWGRNRVSFKRWVEMDLFYIDNWSLWLDLKLIAHTVRVVFSGTGM